ncbi:helix-turn-helix domain-containing protein [Methylobacterium sp. WL120]|uniref:helix-turn-helix domain-containing protein n=1 Tax=Methylobacterium sp. WL120 TaxID=2603887 RepID=UPI0011C8DB6D|nr:helix-turn-helix domain-containing protein [Methylobacterium sp. WL120]TXM58310.1 helix-turn-helix domain-containing protein [Methylobacterium sp. WL120]
MEQFPECRAKLLQNLSIHAALARNRMGLSLFNASRLLGINQDYIEGIEQGEDSGLSIEIIRSLAQGLGLTKTGTPRVKPMGAM